MATDGCNGSASTFAVYAQYWDRNVPSAVVRYAKNVTLVLNGTTVSTNISFSRLTMCRLQLRHFQFYIFLDRLKVTMNTELA